MLVEALSRKEKGCNLWVLPSELMTIYSKAQDLRKRPKCVIISSERHLELPEPPNTLTAASLDHLSAG